MDIEQSFSIQTMILLVSIVGMIVSAIMMYKYKARRGWIVGPLTLFINVFLFTGVLHLEYAIGNFTLLDPQWTLIWSSAIRLHALLLAIAFVIVPVRSG